MTKFNFLSKTRWLLVPLLLLTLGVSQMWAAENDTHYFFDVSSGWGEITTWGGYSSHDAEDVYVTSANANNGNWDYIGMGCAKSSSATPTMGTTTATTYPTKKLTVHVAMYRDNDYLSITSAKIYVYSSYTASSHTYSTKVDEINVLSQYTASNNSDAITIEATPTSGDSWESGVYFLLELGVTNSHTGKNGKAHRTGIDKFYATEGAASTPSCTNTVTVTKGASINGSFDVYQGSNKVTFNNQNKASFENCGTSDLSLQVVPSPSTHYHVAAVTKDGNTAVTADSNGKYFLTYTKNTAKSDASVSVTFAADPTALYIGDGAGDKTKLDDYSYPAAIPEELASQYAINGWTFTGCWSKNEFVSADGTTAFENESYFVNGEDYGASANLYAIYQQGTVFSTKPVACVDISKATITINDITPAFNTSSKKWETTISWSEVNGADEYAYEVRNTTDNSEVTSGNTSSNSLSITTLANENKAYKVTIIASNSCPSGNMTEDFEKIFSITKKYTLSYNTDGGSTAPATSYEFAEATITAASAPTKTGYTFTGWKLGSTETIKQAGETFSMPSSDLELIAQWQIKSFTVTFDQNANDATGEMANQVHDYSTTPVALNENAFTREGYQFMGWATSQENANAGTVAYADGANYTFTASATLYAVWAVKHTVTYTAATGTAPAEVEVAEGTQTTLPNALTGMPDGCNWELVGWYCGNDDLALTNTTTPTSNYGAKNTNVTINGDVTYKAVYKKTVNTQTPTTITGTTKEITANIASGNDWATSYSGTYTAWNSVFAEGVSGSLYIDVPSTATVTKVKIERNQTWSSAEKSQVTIYVGENSLGTVNLNSKSSAELNVEDQVAGADITITHSISTKHSNISKITITYSYDGVEETDVDYYSTSTDCCTAYNVNIADGITGGTVESNKAKECAGETVTLTITPDDGKELDELIVNDVDVTDDVEEVNDKLQYSFTMPAAAVAVNATFKNQATPFISLTETVLDFEQVEKNTTSGELTFTLNANEGCTANVAWELTGDAVFNVTPASPIALANAQAGQTITVTFSPTAAQDYSATLTFSTTGAESKSIALSGTGINLYTVTFDKGTGDCETASAKQASLGASVELPSATPSPQCAAENWVFAGWSETAVADETETEPTLLSGETYTPSENKTLYAVYKRTDGDYASDEIDADFTGVTSTSYVAWTNKKGSESEAIYAGSSATNNNGSLQIKSKESNTGIIMTTSGGNVSKVTVEWNSSTSNGGTLDIYGKNTAYSAATDLFGSVSEQGTKLGSIVKGTSTELEISGNYAFIGMRSNDGAIYLDKITVEMGSSTTVYHSTPSCTGKATLTYNANEPTTGSAPAAVEYDINDVVTVAAMPDGLAKTGHDFAGWNTKADGTGTTYAAGTGSFTIKKNITLYAKWTKKSYTVTVTDPGNGNSITAPVNNASVEYGAEVTLTSSATTHWTFNNAWSVVETVSGDPVTVSEGKFTMPAAAVTVSATFVEDAKRTVKFYSNGTQIGNDQVVYVGEKPVAETAVYDACLEGSNLFYGWATAEWSGAIDATALAGKTVYTGTLPDVVAGENAIEYYAIWRKANKANTFNILSDANDFVSGADYIIASYDYDGEDDWKLKAENYNSNTNQQVATQTSIGSNYEETDGKYIWTITTENGNAVSIYNEETKKYLAINSSNLVLQDAKATFTKSVTDGGSYSDHFEFAVNTNYLNFYDDSHPYYNAYTKKDGALYLYKRDITYSDFRTNCCGLKPVTGLTVSEVAETSVTLSWTAPSDKTGITKLQVVNADNASVVKDNISKDATSVEVTNLEECTTYHFYVASVGSECDSKSASVPATPYSGALTVTFDYNGGGGSVTSASTSCGVTTVNLPTPDDRDGYHFKGWNDGTQTLDPSTETYTPAATMTLTAQWAQLFTVHYDFDGASGAPADAQYEAGETIELPSEPYKSLLAPFEAWDYSVEVTTVDETHFTMPTSDLTITATYDEKVGQWLKVTNTNTLSAGDYVVIASEDWEVAMSTTQNSNNRGVTEDITKSGSTITVDDEESVQVFVLEAGTAEGSWAFKCLNGAQKDNYIYAVSTSNNQLKSKTTKDGNASWVLDIANGKATAQGTATHNILSYNGQNDVFSAYGSVQGKIVFYQFREGTFYNVNLPSPAVTGGVLEASASMAKAGETVTLTYYPTKGYTVGTLTVTDADEAPVAVSPAVEAGVTEYTFTMPAEGVTVAATFNALPPVVYNLMEDPSTLIMGQQFVFVGTTALGTDARVAGAINNNRLSADAINDGAINTTDKTLSLTDEAAVDYIIEGEPGAYKIMNEGMFLKEYGTNQITWDATGRAWNITIVDGKTVISTTVGSDTYKFQYNTSGNYFTAYKTDQQPIYIYTRSTETYNLQFQEENETPIKTITIAEGYTYKYTIKSTDRPSVIPETYEFLMWTDGTNRYKTGDVVTVSAETILKPCWKVTPTANVDINDLPATVTEIVVTYGKTLTVDENRTLDNLTVEAGGKVETTNENELTVINNLLIKTSLGTISGDGTNTNGKCGEITNGSKIVANGDVFLEIELTQDAEASYGWYAFSVPFPVDALNGVYYGNTKLTNEDGYAIMSYHGDVRAQGQYAWKKYRGIMQPGVLYIIAVGDTDYKTLCFKKVSGADLIASNEIAVKEYPLNGGTTGDNGWNGIGNPNLQVSRYTGSYLIQFLDHQANSFKVRNASAVNLMVGSAFMMQSTATENITITAGNGGSIALAPACEMNAEENTLYEVKLRNNTTNIVEDNLFFMAREDATNSYETGYDLVKLSMGEAKCAQMYVPAYGTKLCAADFQLVNDKAEYPLTITAPAAGSYRIEAAEAYEDATLYLTKDGRAIWNLSMSACEVELTKGTTENYGLLLVRKAPGVATGNLTPTLSQGEGAKILIDEHVYILRGGQMYDVTGKAVK